MAHPVVVKDSILSNDKIVPLNQDIGYLLTTYLDGLDVIRFMEVVNGSEEFNTIEITEEQIFYKIFIKFVNKLKVKADIPYLNPYMDSCFIDEEGYLYPEEHGEKEAPAFRVFIHPTFTIEALKQLCCTYNTSSFQCYTRLLPLNSYSYAGNLILIDYFHFKNSIGCMRDVNVHEKSLLKGMNLLK